MGGVAEGLGGLMQGMRLAPGEVGVVQFRKKPSGRYAARVRFRDHTGAWRSLQVTAETKSAADRRVREALGRALETSGSGEYSSKTTFGVVAEEWYSGIEDLVEHGQRSPSTLGLYRHVLDRHVLPGLGSLRLAEMTPARVDRFLQDKRRSAGYSTAKLCRSVASGVCGLAVRRDALRSNPVRDVSTLERRGEREARALSPQECREWLAILDASLLARRKDLPDLTRFLLGTGCRLGEGVGVHWEDLDLDRHLLRVHRTVLRVKGRGLVAKQPKTRSGQGCFGSRIGWCGCSANASQDWRKRWVRSSRTGVVVTGTGTTSRLTTGRCGRGPPLSGWCLTYTGRLWPRCSTRAV